MTVEPQAYFRAGEVLTRDGLSEYEFFPTSHTASPWGETFQHGAPPAALLTHALERAAAEAGLDPTAGRFSRVTTDILAPVPLSRLLVSARVRKPGRRVCLLEAVIRDPASGREVVSGSAWWIRAREEPQLRRELSPLVPGPDEAQHDEGFFERWGGAYIDTIEVRSARLPRGDVAGRTPAPALPGALPEVWDGGSVHWIRTDLPVIAGQADSPWLMLSKVVDSANGLGTGLSPDIWSFMNVDTSVYLNRLPEGEWIGVLPDANYGPDGIGVTVTRLYDIHGPVGTANQSIMMVPHQG